MKRLCLLVTCCLLATCSVFAQTKKAPPKAPVVKGAPTTCGSDPVLSSDGTDSQLDLIAPASVAFYTLNAKGGHSYAVEVWDTVDQTAGMSPTITLLQSDCATSVPNTQNVTSVDPDISGGFSYRLSWIQASDATVEVQLSNPDQNNPYEYQIRVTDTTLFNPRWTTFSGFDTQWGLNNTTGGNITGTMTVVDNTGVVVATIPETLPPGLVTVVGALASSVPTNKVGNATFAYIGPAGAVQADAYYLRSGQTIPSVFASKHAYH